MVTFTTGWWAWSSLIASATAALSGQFGNSPSTKPSSILRQVVVFLKIGPPVFIEFFNFPSNLNHNCNELKRISRGSPVTGSSLPWWGWLRRGAHGGRGWRNLIFDRGVALARPLRGAEEIPPKHQPGSTKGTTKQPTNQPTKGSTKGTNQRKKRRFVSVFLLWSWFRMVWSKQDLKHVILRIDAVAHGSFCWGGCWSWDVSIVPRASLWRTLAEQLWYCNNRVISGSDDDHVTSGYILLNS